MNELVRICCSEWDGKKCRFSTGLTGWGCKLLTCMPESLPSTIEDKKRLFANVYRVAEAMGVLQCPHYDESTIDRTLDNKEELENMVKVGTPIQTDLLSDFISDICK